MKKKSDVYLKNRMCDGWKICHAVLIERVLIERVLIDKVHIGGHGCNITNPCSDGSANFFVRRFVNEQMLPLRNFNFIIFHFYRKICKNNFFFFRVNKWDI